MKATLCNNSGQIFWQTDVPLDAMPLGNYIHQDSIRELIAAASNPSLIAGPDDTNWQARADAKDRLRAALKAVQP